MPTKRTVLVSCAVLVSISATCWGKPDNYAEELRAQARAYRLAEHPEWHVLLHYKPRLFSGGVESLVDAESFFNSPQGKHDPQEELDATLESFFSSAAQGAKDEHAQCRFIARYRWLKQQLHFDADRLPEQACDEFHVWMNELNAGQLTLVFPAAYLNNPASMFGHTLFRVDPKGQDNHLGLLAYAVNYAAHAEQQRGIPYVFKGLFGGYPGRFSVAPYYVSVKQYSDIENRDIWEYTLNLEPEEIDRLLAHLWEMQWAYFDYYFLDENCSYHLLSLLEVARPGLTLTEAFEWWAIPADTVRAVTEQAGLLAAVRFRPARSTVLRQRERALSAQSQRLAKGLVAGEIEADAESLRQLPPTEHARVLELALEYLAYRRAGNHGEGKVTDPGYLDLLKARSQIPVPDQTPVTPVPAVRPDEGHKSARIGVGLGVDDGDGFAELTFRPGYHDLLDPEGGYTQGAQVEVFSTALRYDIDESKLDLQSIRFLDLVSLVPRSRLLKPFSWKAAAELTRRHFAEDDRPLVPQLGGGMGLTYELFGNTLAYLFADAALPVSGRFDHGVMLGIGPSLGVLGDLSARWRVELAGFLHWYVSTDQDSSYEIALNQRVKLTSQSTLQFTIARKREFGGDFTRASLALHFYF
jgi:hypothetical protein